MKRISFIPFLFLLGCTNNTESNFGTVDIDLLNGAWFEYTSFIYFKDSISPGDTTKVEMIFNCGSEPSHLMDTCFLINSSSYRQKGDTLFTTGALGGGHSYLVTKLTTSDFIRKQIGLEVFEHFKPVKNKVFVNNINGNWEIVYPKQ